ncbi:formyltransferase family protein [Alphaproteobacteria bacterium]|nr:formyltransferase family protein [Alphaproteobacteria bacterium]
MKIALFGNKISTQAILDRLVEFEHSVVVFQVSSSSSHGISGYHEISKKDLHEKISVELVSNYSLKTESDLDHFKTAKFDVGICAGWQRLIPQSILDTFRFGVFGWHGSPFHFPNGRGRSPLNWSLRLGLSEVNLYCFRYSSGADDGDIFNVTNIPINRSALISDLQEYTLPIIINDVNQIIQKCQNNNFALKKQSHKAFIYFPKLTPDDGELKIGLHNPEQFVSLIKASSRPFPGAFMKLEDGLVRIWDGDLFLRPKNGKIVCKENEINFTDNTLLIGFKEQILISKDFERVEQSTLL